MPRPSRNLDRALLAAGMELFPVRGCAGLSVREVTDAAGVNLGMFHYHFKSREAFLRAVLQAMYEDMYGQLASVTREQAVRATPLDQLRLALRFMGRFVRANRPVIARVIADALCGEPIAVDFMRENFPRHIGVIHGLVAAALEAGQLMREPPLQLMAFCAGSIATPILFGGAIAASGEVAKPHAASIQDTLLSDAAIDARIELALAAIARPAAGARAKPRGASKGSRP
jgi:AcrR family transcriptional regulator